jgi:hypothetical protein
MGRCGATELRGVTAGTTSPGASRLAVRVTPATLMPVPVPAIVPVLVLVMTPASVLVMTPVLVLVMNPASVPVRGCRGEFRGMYRVTGDRDGRSPRRPS